MNGKELLPFNTDRNDPIRSTRLQIYARFPLYIVKILVKDFHQDILNPSDLFYCSLSSLGSCISNKRRRTLEEGRTGMMSQEREGEKEVRGGGGGG